jgi:alkyldihydroxyacetonephosphate synthase
VSVASDARHPHRWGYLDSQLELDGPRNVRMNGNRYVLSGQSMPHLIPFVEQMLGLPFNPESKQPIVPARVPEPRLNPALMTALEQIIPADRRSIDPQVRLQHSHGSTSVREIDRALYRGGFARVVDLVVEPDTEQEVQAIVTAAVAHDACLVPYGGGTNVSGALLCPEDEARTVVSMDMRRMRRVLSIDRANGCALVEAGISGAALEQALADVGWISGHEPDSLEFSTVGGWISTNASGMKKNRYGNIEDIVLEATLVTPSGTIETYHRTSRTSTGMQPLSLLFGSEGNLGVITKALIAIHPKPEARRYASLVFRSFGDGIACLQALRAERILPASIRLVNNREFRFGQALKPAAHGVKALKESLQRTMLTRVLGFDPKTMAACTIVMEGTEREVAEQERVLRQTAKRFRALWGGEENGRRGYTLTFAIGYLRDFMSQYGLIGESFETSVPWNRIESMCAAVDRALASECAKRGVIGTPYLSYRVTQTYHAGVCVYFTMGFSAHGLADTATAFDEIEHALRQVVLDNGGSLSHHHGVGKIRQPFLPQVHSAAGLELIRAAKRAVDPGNVFGIGNGACGREPSA